MDCATESMSKDHVLQGTGKHNLAAKLSYNIIFRMRQIEIEYKLTKVVLFARVVLTKIND